MHSPLHLYLMDVLESYQFAMNDMVIIPDNHKLHRSKTTPFELGEEDVSGDFSVASSSGYSYNSSFAQEDGGSGDFSADGSSSSASGTMRKWDPQNDTVVGFANTTKNRWGHGSVPSTTLSAGRRKKSAISTSAGSTGGSNVGGSDVSSNNRSGHLGLFMPTRRISSDIRLPSVPTRRVSAEIPCASPPVPPNRRISNAASPAALESLLPDCASPMVSCTSTPPTRPSRRISADISDDILTTFANDEVSATPPSLPYRRISTGGHNMPALAEGDDDEDEGGIDDREVQATARGVQNANYCSNPPTRPDRKISVYADSTLLVTVKESELDAQDNDGDESDLVDTTNESSNDEILPPSPPSSVVEVQASPALSECSGKHTNRSSDDDTAASEEMTRKLPTHTNSFELARRKFQRRGAFVALCQNQAAIVAAEFGDYSDSEAEDGEENQEKQEKTSLCRYVDGPVEDWENETSSLIRSVSEDQAWQAIGDIDSSSSNMPELCEYLSREAQQKLKEIEQALCAVDEDQTSRRRPAVTASIKKDLSYGGAAHDYYCDTKEEEDLVSVQSALQTSQTEVRTNLDRTARALKGVNAEMSSFRRGGIILDDDYNQDVASSDSDSLDDSDALDGLQAAATVDTSTEFPSEEVTINENDGDKVTAPMNSPVQSSQHDQDQASQIHTPTQEVGKKRATSSKSVGKSSKGKEKKEQDIDKEKKKSKKKSSKKVSSDMKSSEESNKTPSTKHQFSVLGRAMQSVKTGSVHGSQIRNSIESPALDRAKVTTTPVSTGAS